MSQVREDLPTIHLGKHDVENDEVEMELLNEMQPICSIFSDINDKARLRKPPLQKLCSLRFVLDKENSGLAPIFETNS